jgi:hypothetical protein
LRAVYWVLIGRPPSSCLGYWLRYSLFFISPPRRALSAKIAWWCQRCPLWIISGHFAEFDQCPLYPRKRTSFGSGLRVFVFCDLMVARCLCFAVVRARQRCSVAKHREELAEQFFSGNAATYDQIASFSTWWLDGWWKRKMLSKIPKTSNRILEQASCDVTNCFSGVSMS